MLAVDLTPFISGRAQCNCCQKTHIIKSHVNSCRLINTNLTFYSISSHQRDTTMLFIFKHDLINAVHATNTNYPFGVVLQLELQFHAGIPKGQIMSQHSCRIANQHMWFVLRVSASWSWTLPIKPSLFTSAHHCIVISFSTLGFGAQIQQLTQELWRASLTYVYQNPCVFTSFR